MVVIGGGFTVTEKYLRNTLQWLHLGSGGYKVICLLLSQAITSVDHDFRHGHRFQN